MKTQKSLLLLSLALGTTSLIAACGDDEPSGDPIDANDHDAEGDPPDSMPPRATRSGTIAITEVALTSAQGGPSPGLAVQGGAVSIEFNDLTQGGGELLFGTSPVGGCVVIKYDADHQPSPPVDAGTITVSDPEVGKTGLLKPLAPCSYVAGAGYLCVGGGGANQNASASASASSINYVFADQDITGQDLVGSYLSVNGFGNDTFNSGTSAFPIVSAQQQAGVGAIITVAKQQAPVVAPSEADIAFSILNGAGPVPTNVGITVDTDFLGDESNSIRIQKPADPDWGAIDFTVYTRGNGFALTDESAKPHQFPATAPVDGLTFACTGGTNGSCGADTNFAGLEATIISGRTTDVVLPSTPDFFMPPASAATEYTTFQCGFLLSPGSADTIPADAVTAILSTNPTRIETRVLRVAGTRVTEGPEDLNSLTIVVGHGLVGHTSF